MRKCGKINMRFVVSTILYAACTFRPYKSTPVLKLFRTFTGKMTRGLSLRMVFSLLFQDTLLVVAGTLRGFIFAVRYGSVDVQFTRLRALCQGTLTS